MIKYKFDVHDTKTRSYNMSKIRSKDTKPELLVRNYLFANGFRYRLHKKNLPGKPDITLRKYSTIIFVHGCFWHGHKGCKYFIVPKTRTEWWLNKINRNKELYVENTSTLKKQGWNVLTIFECELRTVYKEKTLSKIQNELNRIARSGKA